ncbi:MAG: DUF58 domain-containing protein [Pseudomonadales bacterium]
MFSSILRERIERFFAARRPRLAQHVLTRRNLYIFPTPLGGFYLLCVVLIWLLGTNYENNLILALCYLLIALMLVAIFHTFGNLRGLRLQLLPGEGAFPGTAVSLILRLIRAEGCQALEVYWRGDRGRSVVCAAGESPSLTLKATRRGVYSPPSLVLSSIYPLGLFRCWTVLDFNTEIVVYPAPAPRVQHAQITAGDSYGKRVASGGDLQGLRSYIPGEPMSQVSWKHYARNEQLLSKDISRYSESPEHLRWSDYPQLNTEQRLEQLCLLAQNLAAQHRAFALELPECRIESRAGASHFHEVLSALAHCSLAPSRPVMEVEDE